MLNYDTHDFYMVMVKDTTGVISEDIFDTKAKANREIKEWRAKGQYVIEILHYTGTPDDQLATYWGTYTTGWRDKGY